jgi:hypothetical protein
MIMGLDMHLIETSTDKEIAYWRKHPNLHGFIVNEFAGGVDECQHIPLTLDNVKAIIVATKEDTLPVTTGFFFGQSHPDDKVYTLEVFTKLFDTMTADSKYKVYYRASW